MSYDNTMFVMQTAVFHRYKYLLTSIMILIINRDELYIIQHVFSPEKCANYLPPGKCFPLFCRLLIFFQNEFFRNICSGI